MAREGPKTGYDLHLGGHRQRAGREAMMSSSTWVEVKKNLLSRGLIEKLPKKEDAGGSLGERGRKRELYWLTEEGIITALMNNADPDILLKLAQENLTEPELSKRILWIRITKILGLDTLVIFYMSLKYNAFPMNPSLFKDEKKLMQLLELLMTHPDYHKVIKALPQAFQAVVDMFASKNDKEEPTKPKKVS